MSAHPLDNVISMGALAANIGISALPCCWPCPWASAWGIFTECLPCATVFWACFGSFRRWRGCRRCWRGLGGSLATLLELPCGDIYYYLNNLKLSMLFIIFVGAFFPVLTSSIHGVSSVNRTLLDSARLFGASEGDIFRKILLPAAAPSI